MQEYDNPRPWRVRRQPYHAATNGLAMLPVRLQRRSVALAFRLRLHRQQQACRRCGSGPRQCALRPISPALPADRPATATTAEDNEGHGGCTVYSCPGSRKVG